MSQAKAVEVFKPEEFRTPSLSKGKGMHGGCVAVAMHNDAIGVRDTKDPNSPTLIFNDYEWTVFVAAVKAGEFDTTK